MIKRDDNNQYVGVACDTCGEDAPSAEDILKGFGLEHGFGWYCSGGTHICANCPHPRTPEQRLDDKRFHQPLDRNDLGAPRR